MGSELIIIPIIFGAIFGVFYLYFSTRNKERLALIEKGADASIFMKGRSSHTAPIWKVLILNLALLLMGIGLGVFIASILDHYTTLDEDAVYPAIIFFMAGMGLFIGFNMTKNLDKE
jgi:flagellar biosynthesis protein FliQ